MFNCSEYDFPVLENKDRNLFYFEHHAGEVIGCFRELQPQSWRDLCCLPEGLGPIATNVDNFIINRKVRSGSELMLAILCSQVQPVRLIYLIIHGFHNPSFLI